MGAVAIAVDDGKLVEICLLVKVALPAFECTRRLLYRDVVEIEYHVVGIAHSVETDIVSAVGHGGELLAVLHILGIGDVGLCHQRLGHARSRSGSAILHLQALGHRRAVRAHLVCHLVSIACLQCQRRRDEPVVGIVVFVTGVACTVVRVIRTIRAVACLEEIVPCAPIEITRLETVVVAVDDGKLTEISLLVKLALPVGRNRQGRSLLHDRPLASPSRCHTDKSLRWRHLGSLACRGAFDNSLLCLRRYQGEAHRQSGDKVAFSHKRCFVD